MGTPQARKEIGENNVNDDDDDDDDDDVDDVDDDDDNGDADDDDIFLMSNTIFRSIFQLSGFALFHLNATTIKREN